MPLITEVRGLTSPPGTIRSPRPAPEAEWRLLVLDDGRRVRVDVEQVAHYRLEAGEVIDAEIVAILEARDKYLQARERALRLLAVRSRSAFEIRERLTRDRVPASTIRRVLAEFSASRILDDAAFARGWVGRRLAQAYGARGIRWELRQRGVASEVIDRALAEAARDGGGVARLEEEKAIALVRRRLRSDAGLAPAQRARRAAGLLERRGFSAATIARVLRAIGHSGGAEHIDG